MLGTPGIALAIVGLALTYFLVLRLSRGGGMFQDRKGNDLSLTLTLKLDQKQYETIVNKLDQLLAAEDDKEKLVALTQQLKDHQTKLDQVIDQNKTIGEQKQ